MKTALKIARTELKTLFYSPIGWLVLIIFIIQSTLDFIPNLVDVQQISVVGTKQPGITHSFFGPAYGLFVSIQSTLYLYLPLLTMGLMSREISTGSIKLLLSSPITIGEIIFGKLIGILSYCMLMMAVPIAFILVTIINVPMADIGLMFSGLLGIFLMTSVYVSIGLYMSSLTGYQPIAAISTFAVLAALNFIGSLGQNIDFIRNIGSFLAINGRTEQMLDGLITTRQLSYFLIMSGLFTGLTVLKLELERRPRSLGVRVLKYTSAVVIALALSWLASLPKLTVYFDVTQTKDQTVSETSKQILSKMPQLKVHTYVNLLGDDAIYGWPENHTYDKIFLDRYQRFLHDDILIDYTYYYDSLPPNDHIYHDNPGISMKILAENIADSKGIDMALVLDSVTIKKVIDLKPWKNRFVRQLEVAGKTTFIGMYQDGDHYPGEQEMMDALKLLNVRKPHVYFLTGHNERVAEPDGKKDRDYDTRMVSAVRRSSMINHGFDFRLITADSLEKPGDISLLIIADPMLSLKQDELLEIQRYIADGGNLWVLGEPNRKGLVNPIVNPLGVYFMDGTLLMQTDKYKDLAPNFLITNFTKEASQYSGAMKELYEESANVTTTGASGLLYDTAGFFKIEPFIVTNNTDTWNHKGFFDSMASKIDYDPAHGDTKGIYPIALTLKRNINGKEQRIMVFGDSDMFSETEFNSDPPHKLWELTQEVFKWFTAGEFPLDLRRPDRPDDMITISLGGITWLRAIFLFIIPGILFLTGSILLLIRKRK